MDKLHRELDQSSKANSMLKREKEEAVLRFNNLD